MVRWLPNALTLTRLASLPVTITLFRHGHGVSASAVFLCAMLTDCFDGWLARRLDAETRIGLYLDPVVDKVLVLTLLYELSLADLLPIAIAHLFVARELLQNGIRAAAASCGEVVGANWMGKTKATLQSTLLTWGLLMPSLTGWLGALGYQRCLWGLLGFGWVLLLLSWGFFLVFLWWNRRKVLGRSPG